MYNIANNDWVLSVYQHLWLYCTNVPNDLVHNTLFRIVLCGYEFEAQFTLFQFSLFVSNFTNIVEWY